jgi:hypothetical protein
MYLPQWREKLEGNESLYKFRNQAYRWGCCALGERVKIERGTKLKRTNHILTPKAIKLGIQFNDAVYANDRVTALSILKEIEKLDNIWDIGKK